MAGGLGTLEELLEIWVARTLGMHHKPVVVLDPTGVYDHLRSLVDTLTDRRFVRREAAAAISWTTRPDEALDAVEAALARPAGERAGAVPEPVEELLEAEP
jgi:predicted Rossmann-fold nucleotide-binding protein